MSKPTQPDAVERANSGYQLNSPKHIAWENSGLYSGDYDAWEVGYDSAAAEVAAALERLRGKVEAMVPQAHWGELTEYGNGAKDTVADVLDLIDKEKAR